MKWEHPHQIIFLKSHGRSSDYASLQSIQHRPWAHHLYLEDHTTKCPENITIQLTRFPKVARNKAILMQFTLVRKKKKIEKELKFMTEFSDKNLDKKLCQVYKIQTQTKFGSVPLFKHLWPYFNPFLINVTGQVYFNPMTCNYVPVHSSYHARYKQIPPSS